MANIPAMLARFRAKLNAPERTLAQALSDHGIFYTRQDDPNGMIRIYLHSAKGLLGRYRAHEAWDLIHDLEDRA